MSKYSIDRLPLPAQTVQTTLPRLSLGKQPTAQRRSTQFATSTPGVWARVNPLWAAWPLRISREDIEEMGVDIENGGQVTADQVLARWDPRDGVAPEDGQSRPTGLRSSKHRQKLKPELLGISPGILRDDLVQLDVGDAVEICDGSDAAESSSDKGKAREMLVDVLAGRAVVTNEDVPSPEDQEVARQKGAPPEVIKTSTYGPWSTRYFGHQFGSYAGQLGDGRAISILETESVRGGRQEIQLKGAGRTPFSRSADGLAVLRSGVREFLGCEAVAALGIPTTRSLALLTANIQDIPVMRENGPEPPSLLARVAPTFIRIGHFQALNPGPEARGMRQLFLFGGRMTESKEDTEGPLEGHGNLEGLRELTAWCKNVILKMPTATVAEWVDEVIRLNAVMVGQWQVYGYCHGVLNTDNISIAGLTIDYGPYAFMDIWDEGHICNHSDETGLYSYRKQPSRVLFALDKLVSALSPLIGYEAIHGSFPTSGFSAAATRDQVEEWQAKGVEIMQGFEERFFETERRVEKEGWHKRFGLRTDHNGDDREVIFDFLNMLHSHNMDFHTSLRRLALFLPTRVTEERYVDRFASETVRQSTTALSDEAKEAAAAALSKWLKRFAERASLDTEQQAWAQVQLDTDEHKFGSASQGASSWAEKRQEGMKRVNPRFVLRQWVLEDTIATLEKAGVEDIVPARKALAKILDMASRPFYPWGEGDAPGEMFSEAADLCGVGRQEMLGFQCSCSS